MPELSTTTHHIEVPVGLEKTYVIADSLLKAETAKAGHTIQCPECSVVVSGYPAHYSFEKWVAFKVETYCDAPQELASETLEVIGKQAPWREVSDRWSWNEKEATVHYFLGGVPTGLGPWFLFQAYCEADVVEIYRPLFQSIWQSLVWNGDVPVDPDGPVPTFAAALPEDEPALELPLFAPPEEGRGFAAFDQQKMDLSYEHCSIAVDPWHHELHVELRLRPEQLRAFRDDLVSEHALDDGLGFRFTFSGIHKEGVPTGEFELKDDNSEGPRFGFWKDGWDYSLHFTGKLIFCDSWFAMTGFLKKAYDDEPAIQLEAYLRIESETLDWSDYRFLSLEETRGADPSTVRYLQLPTLESETLPEAIFDFANLRELTIGPLFSYGLQETELSLAELDSRIGDFACLEVLTIHHCALPGLPSSIGKLKALKGLSLVNTGLESTPPGLWELSALEYLYLSANRLSRLPESIKLPSLHSLDLAKNSLSTLPVSLLDSTKLRTLSLGSNPWEQLDPRFLDVKNLNLDQPNRVRLFDYSYQGADGNGLTEWDDSAYHLGADSELWQKFEDRLKKSDYSQHLDALRTIAKRTLFFALAEEDDDSTLGTTRFGGMPDLPKTLDYPTWTSDGNQYGYEFVAQLNCQELAPLQNYLPRSGMLYFFVSDQEQFQPAVLYFDGPSSELLPGCKIDLEAYPLIDQYGERTTPYRAKVETGWSLPSGYASYCNTHDFPGEAQILTEHDDLLDHIHDHMAYAEPQKHHEVNGYVFTQHEGPELQASLAKRGNPEDWMVLLKVASLGDFQWWDAGEIFFVIHKSDLKKADFSQVFCGLESS